jgi:hypothetical protein
MESRRSKIKVFALGLVPAELVFATQRSGIPHGPVARHQICEFPRFSLCLVNFSILVANSQHTLERTQLPSKMLIEEQRFLHEDLERLEQGISDRMAEDPRNVIALVPSPQSQSILTSFVTIDKRPIKSRPPDCRLPHPYPRTIPASP